MKWHRAFSIGTFWISVVALLVALGLYWSVFLSPAAENPGSDEAKKIVMAAGVPFLVALTVALISLLSRGLDRIDSSDTEYCQFCIDELDRFKNLMLLGIEHEDATLSAEFLKGANVHLENCSHFFSRVVNRDRRKSITSHANTISLALSSDLLDRMDGQLLAKKRVRIFFRWSDSKSELVTQVKQVLTRTFLAVDT